MFAQYTADMSVSPGPLRRQLAYDSIREKILSGEFAPGSMLSEAELATLLGISRTPVREALQRLQEDGLATILPRRGALVRILTLPEVREILLVREALEGLAARLATTHMSRAILEGLRAQWQDALDTLEASTLQALDKQGVQFHAVLVEASGNRTLARMLESVRGRIEGTRQIYLHSSGETALRRARLICEEHLRVLDALQAGDADRAEIAMKEHLRQIRAETIGAVE